MKSRTILAVIGFALGMLAAAPSVSQAQRVLFIGNSLIGYNDMPSLFQHLAASTGHDAYVEEYIWYGHSLKANESRPEVLAAFAGKKWDYVVIQEYSTVPLTDPAEFDQDVLDYAKLSKASGARMVLFENWPLRGEATLPQLVEAYATADQPVNALIAPMGPAWATVTTSATVNLYRADGKHPTPIATYLGACILYGLIYHQTPVGLVHDGISVIPRYPDGTYGGIPQPRDFLNLDTLLGAADVNYIQSVAAGLVTLNTK